MGLPGLIEINNQFFIKVDKNAILLKEVTRLEKAVAYLFMYYYVLNLNFPESLKFVYGFFERCFNIDNSINSQELKILCASVFPSTSI